jgi:hypothetical protein
MELLRENQRLRGQAASSANYALSLEIREGTKPVDLCRIQER